MASCQKISNGISLVTSRATSPRSQLVSRLLKLHLSSRSAIPNLFLLETLSSIKVADLLQKNLSSERESPLNVYLQVNTSGEDAKSGLPPLDSSSSSGELLDLVRD
jgi:hypothetical protein